MILMGNQTDSGDNQENYEHGTLKRELKPAKGLINFAQGQAHTIDIIEARQRILARTPDFKLEDLDIDNTDPIFLNEVLNPIINLQNDILPVYREEIAQELKKMKPEVYA